VQLGWKIDIGIHSRSLNIGLISTFLLYTYKSSHYKKILFIKELNISTYNI